MPSRDSFLRYGFAHQQTRRQLEPLVAAGEAACARCGRRILPGEPWDLDHSDDRLSYLGPSHARCNRSTTKYKRQAFSRRW